ncbi:hypothetical protein IMZ11_12955 [Microtetraspora sp. AC03309]|uniref:hypothetical protein n=1 Tax=Microtetraspora sp. AC03309 TaxID=2779376 RepID=UPI001E5011F1|nr:hypothetical protein [Microtetraspora sp. AC03309]MCC5576540.1 hypothetical protein [Microtetraspora sp. AC03309]
MGIVTSYARALAVREGRAQPIATVRHLHLSARPMVFIPLKLAGEAAAPLGAMVGTDPADPRLLVVPQPRNRDLRFAFMAELAQIMLPYIEGFATATETVTGRNERERYLDAPQILVPGGRAIEFVRLLGRSTRFRRTDGPYPVHPSVPVLGQWLTFLYERTEFAGSSALLPVTEALALHWATGQSPLEDANLATLLAWISPPPGLTGQEAAVAAENPLDWPPAGPDTDPGFDAQVLQHAIRAYDASGSPALVRQALRTQLEPTWRLMWQAVDRLRGLPEAASVAERWGFDRDQYTREVARLADGGPPRGRRDQAGPAAIRLWDMEAAQQTYDAQRAYDDPLVMTEHRATGKAFTGEAVHVDADRRILLPGGKKPVPRPLVTVRTGDPVRLTPGKKVFSVHRRKQSAEIVEIDGDIVVVQLNDQLAKGAGVPTAGDAVCFTELDLGGRIRPGFPTGEETPWTHGGPPAAYVPTDEDAVEAWS